MCNRYWSMLASAKKNVIIGKVIDMFRDFVSYEAQNFTDNVILSFFIVVTYGEVKFS